METFFPALFVYVKFVLYIGVFRKTFSTPVCVCTSLLYFNDSNWKMPRSSRKLRWIHIISHSFNGCRYPRDPVKYDKFIRFSSYMLRSAVRFPVRMICYCLIRFKPTLDSAATAAFQSRPVLKASNSHLGYCLCNFISGVIYVLGNPCCCSCFLN